MAFFQVPMETPRYVSTMQAARALGVSVTTVKRWVDEGVLPAHKTVGRHRKILADDVLRLVREGNWPHADLSLLAGAGQAVGTPDPARLEKELFEAIRQGDTGRGRTLVQDAYRAGLAIDRLADEVVAPAMARMGAGWCEGEVEVYHEHRGTQVCLAALLDLKKELEGHVAEGRPVALGGGPEYDHYLLPNLLVQMVLLENGWDAINIGPNTPMTSFRRALVEFQPRLLWLSCSYLPDPRTFLEGYRLLYAEAEKAGVAVAVGGRALTEAVRSHMPYTSHGDGLGQLAAFARSLHPAPGRPRRGRPPSE